MMKNRLCWLLVSCVILLWAPMNQASILSAVPFAMRRTHHKLTTTAVATQKTHSYPTTLRGGGSRRSSGNVQEKKQQPGASTSIVVRHLLAGGVSRAVAQITLYPIDALRTLAQTRDGRTLADVGVSALLRGCTTTSAFALFMGSIQFAVYELLRDDVGPFWSSAAGAAASCIVSVPQEVIKQRLVTGVYDSFRQAVGTIYRTEGVKGFYSAWKPTMTRNIPFVMTTFTTMDVLKRRRLEQTGKKELTVWENLVIGVSSAMVAGLVTQPVDVVKTRMMTQAASSAIPYKSALDCFTTIVRTEGVFTLYSGLRQRSTYMCLLWGITFALNGKIKEMAARKR